MINTFIQYFAIYLQQNTSKLYDMLYLKPNRLTKKWMSDIYNKGVDWEEKINIRPLKENKN